MPIQVFRAVASADPALDETVLDPAALEAQLRAANPKGVLLERCAALRIGRPEILHRVLRGQHHVEMTITTDEWELASGTCTAPSRKLAEQLAARELLAELEEAIAEGAVKAPAAVVSAAEDEEVWPLEDGDEERLRLANPKGQLLSWCAQRKVARPRFELRNVRGAHCVRASVALLGVTSPWFRASRRLAAEQAAAEALLSLLDDVEADASNRSLDPRVTLHELCQRGTVKAFAFETVAQRGPSHAPQFTVVGTMTLADDVEVQSPPCEGRSKKEALLAAARELVARVP